LVPVAQWFGFDKVKHYFAAHLMKKNRKSYTIFQKVTSIFLMLTLLWLTISTPFVIASQQELARQQKAQIADLPASDSEDESSDSRNNNIEEKVPGSGNTFSEEFLHEHHTTHYFFSEVSLYHKLENSDTYIAFHGELLVPPPNAA
jgi:hypothetical protein